MSTAFAPLFGTVAGGVSARPAPPLVAVQADPLRARGLSRVLAMAGPGIAADVLVLQLGPGEQPGPEARGFEGGVLILSDDPAIAADPAHQAVLPSTATDGQIAAAVAAVAEGLTVRTPALPEPPGFAAPEPGRRSLLTPREVEVLTAVGQGLSNKAIARRLGISAHTVKYHLEAIYTKLDVRSRAEAVTRGLRLGLQVI